MTASTLTLEMARADRHRREERHRLARSALDLEVNGATISEFVWSMLYLREAEHAEAKASGPLADRERCAPTVDTSGLAWLLREAQSCVSMVVEAGERPPLFVRHVIAELEKFLAGGGPGASEPTREMAKKLAGFTAVDVTPRAEDAAGGRVRDAVVEALGFERDEPTQELEAEYHAQGDPPREVLDAVRANYPRAEACGAPTGPGSVLARFEVVGEVNDKALRGWTEGDKQESTHDELTLMPDAWDLGTVITVTRGGPCLKGSADADAVADARHAMMTSRAERDDALARLNALTRAVEAEIADIEDAKGWGGPTMYPSAPDIVERLRAALDAAKGDA